jgi:hypothetical protein
MAGFMIESRAKPAIVSSLTNPSGPVMRHRVADLEAVLHLVDHRQHDGARRHLGDRLVVEVEQQVALGLGTTSEFCWMFVVWGTPSKNRFAPSMPSISIVWWWATSGRGRPPSGPPPAGRTPPRAAGRRAVRRPGPSGCSRRPRGGPGSRRWPWPGPPTAVSIISTTRTEVTLRLRSLEVPGDHAGVQARKMTAETNSSGSPLRPAGIRAACMPSR